MNPVTAFGHPVSARRPVRRGASPAAVALAIAVATVCGAASAHAQTGDAVRRAADAAGLPTNGARELSGSTADAVTEAARSLGGGALSGSSAGSALGSAGLGNVAGLMQFCVKNRFLGGDASSVQQSLVGRLGGDGAAHGDAGFASGARGLVQGGNGHQLELGTGGAKERITRAVCDQVLERGRSLL